MTIDVEGVLGRAFEQAFLRALDQTVQAKAEDLFKKFLAPGSPLAQKLEEKIEQGFQHFLEEGFAGKRRDPVSRTNFLQGEHL